MSLLEKMDDDKNLALMTDKNTKYWSNLTLDFRKSAE